MKQKTAIVMNPSANDWEAKKRWPTMANLLKKHEIDFDLVETRKDRGTISLTQEITEKGYGRVVAVGGDGTINEVLNGIMKADVPEKPKLGLIPFGTANDVCKSFNIWGMNIENHVRNLVDGLEYPLDLGLVNGERYFADCFSVGFEASVLKDRNLTRGRRLLMSKGFQSYVPSAIKELAFYRKAKAAIELDGKEINKKIYSLIVKNSRVYAGSFILNERIRGNDGKLDLFFFKDGVQFWQKFGTQIAKKVAQIAYPSQISTNIPQIAKYISKKADPTGIATNIVDIIIENYEDHQAERIKISLSNKVDSQIDGEEYGVQKEYTIECVKHALNTACPVSILN